MKKIVALNSGGFDSIVMLHWLRGNNPDAEIHTLFFNYFQESMTSEYRCASTWVEKDNNSQILFTSIGLPCPVSMTKEKEYIPMRNLIFLSYAASYAEEIGADKIYIALINNKLPEDKVFFDCTKDFVDNFNKTICGKGITVEAPFINKTKNSLYPYIKRYGIQRDDFHTCNFSNEGCGECPDCVTINELFDRIENPDLYNYWNRVKNPKDEKFKKMVIENPISEVRVHSNHKCQLSCDHCYYSDYELSGRELSYDEMWDKLFVPAIQYGVQNFHFSGKEPLYGDKAIFEYAQRLKSYNEQYGTSVTYDLITNGINIPKYIDVIKELGFSRICVSVDDVNTDKNNSVRHIKIDGVSPKSLECAINSEIPVEVFITPHKGNWHKIGNILKILHTTYGIKQFFIKTILDIGHGEELEELSLNQMSEVFIAIDRFCRRNKDCSVTFNATHNYIIKALKDDTNSKNLFTESVQLVQDYETGWYEENLYLDYEFMCYRYTSQVTVTPDGYILGCASEVSSKDYAENSAGNVLEDSFNNIILKGKNKYLSDIEKSYSIFTDGLTNHYVCDKCTFQNTCIEGKNVL